VQARIYRHFHLIIVIVFYLDNLVSAKSLQTTPSKFQKLNPKTRNFCVQKRTETLGISANWAAKRYPKVSKMPVFNSNSVQRVKLDEIKNSILARLKRY
jgi:hypothetical protein